MLVASTLVTEVSVSCSLGRVADSESNMDAMDVSKTLVIVFLLPFVGTSNITDSYLSPQIGECSGFGLW